MLEAIEERVLTIFQEDSRLIQAGTAWSTPFSGVKRDMAGDTLAAGYINLFDQQYTKDSSTARPAIYVGDGAYESTDEEETPAISAGHIFSYRIIKITLVITCVAGNPYDARKQRNQLRFNVKQILLDHFIEPNYWYSLDWPGNRGGGDLREVSWVSGTGGGDEAIYEAVTRFPLRIRYGFGKTTTSA